MEASLESTIETLIDVFLTRCGRVFTSSQYDIPFDQRTGEGGSSPDMIALDFGQSPKEVIVVEVTTSAALASLYSRILEREIRWYRPLRRQLLASGVIDERWSMRTLAFIRQTNVEVAQSKFANDSDVRFHPIEHAILPHEYWDGRMMNGLPR